MFALFKSQPGYLHLLNACLRWPSSSFSSWGLEQAVLALCVRVLMTLYLAARLWWLSHYKYKSVHSSSIILYTVVMRDLSGCGITNVSKKQMDPSSLDVSEVNWMCGSSQLRCSRNYTLCDVLWPQKCHQHIFSTLLEDAELFWWPWYQNPPCRCWPLWDWLVTSWLLHVSVQSTKCYSAEVHYYFKPPKAWM